MIFSPIEGNMETTPTLSNTRRQRWRAGFRLPPLNMCVFNDFPVDPPPK